MLVAGRMPHHQIHLHSQGLFNEKSIIKVVSADRCVDQLMAL